MSEGHQEGFSPARNLCFHQGLTWLPLIQCFVQEPQWGWQLVQLCSYPTLHTERV